MRKANKKEGSKMGMKRRKRENWKKEKGLRKGKE